MTFFEKYMLQDKKCHLQCQTEMPHYVLSNYAVDCDFHSHVKLNMVRDMTHLIAEKVKFHSEEIFHKYSTIIRGEVYVFSPNDMRDLGKAIEAELKTAENSIAKYIEMETEIINLKYKLAQIEQIAKKEKK